MEHKVNIQAYAQEGDGFVPGHGKIELPRFDVTRIFEKARNLANRYVDGVTVNLPLVSLNVKPGDTERCIANEIVMNRGKLTYAATESSKPFPAKGGP